jgi:hypothetical protein
MAAIINANDNGFIGVSIQYRVSPFSNPRNNLRLIEISWALLVSCPPMRCLDLAPSTQGF